MYYKCTLHICPISNNAMLCPQLWRTKPGSMHGSAWHSASRPHNVWKVSQPICAMQPPSQSKTQYAWKKTEGGKGVPSLATKMSSLLFFCLTSTVECSQCQRVWDHLHKGHIAPVFTVHAADNFDKVYGLCWQFRWRFNQAWTIKLL